MVKKKKKKVPTMTTLEKAVTRPRLLDAEGHQRNDQAEIVKVTRILKRAVLKSYQLLDRYDRGDVRAVIESTVGSAQYEFELARFFHAEEAAYLEQLSAARKKTRGKR